MRPALHRIAHVLFFLLHTHKGKWEGEIYGGKKIDMLILFSVCLASLLIHTPLGSFGGHCTGEGRQDRGAAGV